MTKHPPRDDPGSKSTPKPEDPKPDEHRLFIIGSEARCACGYIAPFGHTDPGGAVAAHIAEVTAGK